MIISEPSASNQLPTIPLISSSNHQNSATNFDEKNNEKRWQKSNGKLSSKSSKTAENAPSIILLSFLSNFVPQRSLKSIVKSLLPSTYLKKILHPKLYRLACYGVWLWWFVIGLLVLRKTDRATVAVSYIKEHGHTVSLERIEKSAEFHQLVKLLETDKQKDKAPAILLLNQHALNMTFNYLCNTKIYSGAHDRLVFVSLDSTTRDVLKQYWPNIRQFYWPTPSLYVNYFN